ncbi:MAG TPA: histidine kinase dimerization/phospho-acceptor domain-containing protein [Gaiellaceae bacterium]|nr:histidine kinase dimerization/phospho-acceptor domain-containing protein [Gaiellaceae bacterium]
MTADRFPRVVSLACHDLRTPLATVYGFARTLARAGELDERNARFVTMMGEAAQQMTELLDDLGAAARIQADRWQPALREADTLELARGADETVPADGAGAPVETEVEAVERALRSLGRAARTYGRVEPSWSVDGRTLVLAPVTAEAAPVVSGEEIRDLGSLVAREVIEALGGSLELDGETLRVSL